MKTVLVEKVLGGCVEEEAGLVQFHRDLFAEVGENIQDQTVNLKQVFTTTCLKRVGLDLEYDVDRCVTAIVLFGEAPPVEPPRTRLCVPVSMGPDRLVFSHMEMLVGSNVDKKVGTGRFANLVTILRVQKQAHLCNPNPQGTYTRFKEVIFFSHVIEDLDDQGGRIISTRSDALTCVTQISTLDIQCIFPRVD